MSGLAYVVTAGCVVARDSSAAGEGYYYEGAVLPAGVPVAEKERLVEAGLVTAVEVEPVLVVEPAVEAVKPARRGRRGDGDQSVVVDGD